jgi:hypothetical protein
MKCSKKSLKTPEGNRRITLNNTGVPYVEQELLKNYGATDITLFVFMRSALFKNIIAINCRFSGYKSVD